MPTIRTDVIKIGDKFATVIGDDVAVGQPAPEFTSVVRGGIDEYAAEVDPSVGIY